MNTTTQPVTADVMVEKVMDWAISSQAAAKSVEGSTHSILRPTSRFGIVTLTPNTRGGNKMPRVQDNQKVCRTCKEAKPLGCFEKMSYVRQDGTSGLRVTCKDCRTAAQVRKYHSDPQHKEKVLAKQHAYHAENRDERNAQSSAWYAKNRETVRAKLKKEREENGDALRAAQKAYRDANPDLIKAQKQRDYERHREAYIRRATLARERNPKRTKERIAQWRKDNPEKIAALSAFRTRRTRDATPAWADKSAIKQIYVDAQAVSAETGVLQHVDHIIPLNGKTVCGLHVAENLRIIPAAENIRKKNKLVEDIC